MKDGSLIAGKWNFKKHDYEPYILPEGTKLISSNMDEKVPCASCGTLTAYGDTFTSLTIHNQIGMGFPVCDACYDKEWKAKRASKQ